MTLQLLLYNNSLLLFFCLTHLDLYVLKCLLVFSCSSVFDQ